MTDEICVRCNNEVEHASVTEIHGLIYCNACAEQSEHLIKQKKADINQEKHEIVQKRDVIEKEMALVSQDDTRHIKVTTTDRIEGRRILEYIDVISVQDINFKVIHFDPAHMESHSGLAEHSFRNSVELSLSSLKKRAYLAGADAVVGLRIDSSIDHQREGEYMAAVMLKVNVSGTAVRLAEPD